jgi:hypothetical protein
MLREGIAHILEAGKRERETTVLKNRGLAKVQPTFAMASAPGYESAFNTQREESEEYPGRSLYVPTAVFATQPEEQNPYTSQQWRGPVTASKFSNPSITGYASTGARQWVASVPLIYGGDDEMPAFGGAAELPAVGGKAKVRALQKEVEKENEVSTQEWNPTRMYHMRSFLIVLFLQLLLVWGWRRG